MDFTGYNLVYYHKVTGKKYLAKRIIKGEYIILDPDTGAKLPLSGWALGQAYEADKDNGKNQSKRKLNFEKRIEQ